MRKGKSFMMLLSLCLTMAASAIGTALTFTDLALDPASGVYHTDFSAGTAIFDFNNDGFDDIVVNNYNTPNRLYMSNGDGTFTDVGGPAGVSSGPHTLGIATSDIDASGFMDFLVFAEDYNPGFLYLNNGNGTFTDASISEFSIEGGYDGYACAFVDFNLDGLLDVFYAGRLFQNNGLLNFVEVNDIVGLGNLAFVAHAAFADIDNDFDPDLFISRQHGDVALFRNDGTGHFTNINGNLEGHPRGLCGSFGDIDNDGDLDLFVSYYNIMYYNDGTGFFTRNHDAGTYSRYTRGSVFADFDNDGDPDLVLANEDGSSTYHENQGNGVFVDVTAEVGMDNFQDKAGGVAVGDFDNDGDLDLYIAKTDNLINPCFRNNLDNNNSISVTPRGTVSNFSGIGSKVYLYEDGHLGDLDYLVGMSELTSTSGFDSGTTGRVHLGTGAPGLFDVRVVFPSGIIVDTAGVNSGSRLFVYESGETPTFLYVSPGNIFQEMDVDAEPETFELSITDSKESGINWTATTDDNWITIENSSGVTPSTLSLTIDPAGFYIGQHNGTIVVTAPDAVNSPITVNVTVLITDYILSQVSLSVGLSDNDFSSGAAFFDYDADGFDDIFVNNIYGVNRLYRSDGTSFTDEAPTAGVTPAFHNLGIFAGDLNADGWADILSFTEDQTVGFTYLNTGFGTFIDAGIEEFSIAAGYDGYSANAADIDNDGDLDVFYGAKLFRNDGEMNFTDITEAAGLSNIAFVCRASFGDIDNDGDMDLFVNRQNLAVTLLFRNDGTGHFEEISDNSSLGHFPTGLGISFGDVDTDGDLDVYLCAGYSDPNYLFLNDGSGFFTDVTQESGTSCNNYSRGSEFFDVDNDGDLDLLVANENRSSQLFMNDGTGHFGDVTDMSGINDGMAKAGGAVVGDYDNDGDLDAYICRTDNIVNSFFENQHDEADFVMVTPVGVVSNRAAVGTKVFLYAGGQLGNPDGLVGYREYNISNGFNGSSENRVHFGTGYGELFDLRLIFPSGIVVDQTDVTPGSWLTVTESGEVNDYLVLVPGGFNFVFSPDDPAAESEFLIKNSAGNPIPWTATVDDAWCLLSSYAGTTDETITVTVDPSGMEPGYYETSITVTAADAVNSPNTAIVRMTIESNQPILALSTYDLYFTGEFGGFNPWPQGFTILNVGQGTLEWTLETSGGSWFSASPSSGTAPHDVGVNCYIDGLDPGMYTGTVTVTAPDAVNSPAVLTVHFEVLPGDIPERDTVRVESAAALPGDELVLPVYLHNIGDVAAFSIPLKFDPNVFVCDSASFVDTRVDYINLVQANIDTANGAVLLGMVVFLEDFLPPGDGIIARLYMKISPDAEEQVAVIDTAFFPPAGEFLLIDPTSATIVPEFVHGNIFISVNMAGDANGSGSIDVSDCVFLVNHIFKGQRPPIPEEAGDANTDDIVNVGDVVFIVNYIFRDGPPPGYAKAPVSNDPIYYLVERVAVGNTTELHLRLDTDIPLGGVQFEISDPVGFINLTSPETGELVNGMTIHQGNTGHSYRFGIFDMQGVGSINPGEGLVFRVGYDGYDDINIESMRVFDEFGNELPTRYGVRSKSEAVPLTYELMQNYPNPFNPATTIKYITVKAGHVELAVFNILGQQVKELVNGDQKEGHHTIIWDGTNDSGNRVASGIYFYRLKTDDFMQSKKMALIK